MNQTNWSDRVSFDSVGQAAPSPHSVKQMVASPDDVLAVPQLTRSEKREILASWASDARAVANAPGLRRLENGAIINLDDILEALRLLDPVQGKPHIPSLHDLDRRRRSRLSRWSPLRRRRRSWDDDNDPPPAPASAGVPLSAATGTPLA